MKPLTFWLALWLSYYLLVGFIVTRKFVTIKSMGRPKLYQSNAEKQRAYRARNAHRLPATDAELAALARTLTSEIHEAAQRDNPVALAMAGDSKAETLRKAIRWFQKCV